MKKLFLLSFLFYSALVHSQNIYTIAGNGNYGYSGDGYPSTSNYVEFESPCAVSVSVTGNIYIADYYNNVIREINSSDTIHTIAGTGIAGYSGDGRQATDAQLNNPQSIFLDKTGDLYIADNENNGIRKINPSGIISTIAGTARRGHSGDGGPATAAELNTPTGVYLDAKGNTYITEYFNCDIRKINTSGIITTIAGIPGIRGFSGDGGPATAAELSYIYNNVYVDSFGNIYFTDSNNERIRKINTIGIISTIAGKGTSGYSGDGGPADSALLYFPTGLYADSIENIYFSDAGNSVVRKINTSGIISTIAGNGTQGYSGDGSSATAAELAGPIQVCGDRFGNMYIPDQGNNVIREVIYKPTGINNIISETGITMYPNPANDILTINFNDRLLNGLVTLSIMDITGRVIISFVRNINTVSMQIDISLLTPGMYLIAIRTAHSFITQKFIKQ